MDDDDRRIIGDPDPNAPFFWSVVIIVLFFIWFIK